MFVDCIHVVFCRPLGLVAGFNAICNACLAGVPSGSLKMCPVYFVLYCFILYFVCFDLFYQSINVVLSLHMYHYLS